MILLTDIRTSSLDLDRKQWLLGQNLHQLDHVGIDPQAPPRLLCRRSPLKTIAQCGPHLLAMCHSPQLNPRFSLLMTNCQFPEVLDSLQKAKFEANQMHEMLATVPHDVTVTDGADQPA